MKTFSLLLLLTLTACGPLSSRVNNSDGSVQTLAESLSKEATGAGDFSPYHYAFMIGDEVGNGNNRAIGNIMPDFSYNYTVTVDGDDSFLSGSYHFANGKLQLRNNFDEIEGTLSLNPNSSCLTLEAYYPAGNRVFVVCASGSF